MCFGSRGSGNHVYLMNVAHPLSCRLTHKLFLFSSVWWATQLCLTSAGLKQDPLLSTHWSNKRHLHPEKWWDPTFQISLLLHRHGWMFNRVSPVQSPRSVCQHRWFLHLSVFGGLLRQRTHLLAQESPTVQGCHVLQIQTLQTDQASTTFIVEGLKLTWLSRRGNHSVGF